MFTLSIILMALPTLLIGLLPTYTALGIAALLLLLLLPDPARAAIRAKSRGPGLTRVAERAQPLPGRCRAAPSPAGLTAGILLGSLVATAINRGMSPVEVSE